MQIEEQRGKKKKEKKNEQRCNNLWGNSKQYNKYTKWSSRWIREIPRGEKTWKFGRNIGKTFSKCD